MKKLYFSFLILISAKTISAQQYFPMLDSINEWNYTSNYIPVRMENPSTAASNCAYPVWFINSMTEYTTTDTVIGAYTYKIVNIVADQNPSPCLFGFVREDTAARKVFFLDNLGNPEITLYDFSMTIGNSIAVAFTNQGYFSTGTFTLDSITIVHINSGFRREFHLNDHVNTQNHELTWIEGTGNLEDAFYPYSYNMSSYGWYSNCPIFPHNNWQFMTCFDHDYKVYYDSCAYQAAVSNWCIYMQDTCNYWNTCSAISEYSALISAEIFPNPTSGKTTLSLDVKHESNFEIRISDISGKKSVKNISLGKINEGKKDIELDLNSLPDGFYVVEIKGDENSVFRKIIIQH